MIRQGKQETFSIRITNEMFFDDFLFVFAAFILNLFNNPIEQTHLLNPTAEPWPYLESNLI